MQEALFGGNQVPDVIKPLLIVETLVKLYYTAVMSLYLKSDKWLDRLQLGKVLYCIFLEKSNTKKKTWVDDIGYRS